jgi:hypothetical protein
MKNVEILGEAPAEIRVGEGIADATTVRANLRRARERIVSPEGTANAPQCPTPTRATELSRPSGLTGATELNRPSGLTRATELSRPSDLTKATELNPSTDLTKAARLLRLLDRLPDR